MDEKTKQQKKIENTATNEIPKPDKICNKKCKICQSKNLTKIHELRNNGKDYSAIVKMIFDDHKEKISRSSLCRHFSNYRKSINLMSAEIINNDMVEQATLQSVHLIKVVKLIDLALKSIESRMANGAYHADVTELEKLMNMRYKLLSGESDSDDMVAVFQQASEKFGFQQGMLLKVKPS